MPARVDPCLLAAAAAGLAPLAACGGLWAARATDPALAHIRAGLRPLSMVLAAGLAIGLAVAAWPTTMAGALVCACLAGSAAADRDQLVLPDILTLAAVTLSLAMRPLAPLESRVDLLVAGVGLYVGAIVFAAAMHLRYGRTAFGLGDVKLIAALGAILPARLIGPAILAGGVSALACVGLPGRTAKPVIALGLHLVVGSALALGAAQAFPSFLGR